MNENILGYNIFNGSVRSCLDSIDSEFESNSNNVASCCRWLACLNPHSYAVAIDDSEFSAALQNADWLVPDGVGIVWASRFLGGKISERVTGSDIFFGLHERLNARTAFSVFFLGSTEDVLKTICCRMAKDYPSIRVAGTFSPPFKSVYSDDELDEMVREINHASPDVLWVGMTAPKQEKWIADNLNRLDVKFAGAVGAVFDFYAGKVKRSHPVFQRLGLEWLPRLLQQPRRLWRRMFVSAPIFIWHTFKARFATSGRSSC